MENRISVFVVDLDLGIWEARVNKEDWNHPAGLFLAEINAKPWICCRGGRGKTEKCYASFEKKREAKRFVIVEKITMKRALSWHDRKWKFFLAIQDAFSWRFAKK